MNHIVRNATLCGDDWCDAKKEIERLKAQVALLREALHSIALAADTSLTTKKDICVDAKRALEQTK